MATAVWDGKGAILCSGGKAANGKVSTDVFLLQLSASRAVWRTLTEWPASAFSGEGFCTLALALALALAPALALALALALTLTLIPSPSPNPYPSP